ncbi:hypothetical protein B0H21DRAFT_726686 [Amylocystis lapponica]|nr:hypothetical protein B0H21DRAFT_726686 [Amylocystis lapponica]
MFSSSPHNITCCAAYFLSFPWHPLATGIMWKTFVAALMGFLFSTTSAWPSFGGCYLVDLFYFRRHSWSFRKMCMRRGSKMYQVCLSRCW